jgi:hypothetical protein
MATAKGDTKALDLFGRRILRVEAEDLVDGVLVPVRNSSSARFSRSTDGRTWIRKREMETGYEAVLAEALGWMLANALKVPAPQAAISGQLGDLSWLSEEVPWVNQWHKDRVHYIQNLDDLGRMLTLDAIIHNHDRHAGNILLEPRPTDLELMTWTIDVGDCLLGHPQDLSDADLDLPSVKNVARGLPVERLREGALAAAEEAELVTKGLLKNMIDEACSLVREPLADVLLDAVWHRMRHARALAARYLSILESVQ